MMRLVVILMLCSWPIYGVARHVDPLYIDMIHDFEEEMVWDVKADIIVKPIPDPLILAFCRMGANTIVVRPQVAYLPYHVRKALIYHELAHCELGLMHTQIGDHSLTDPYIYVPQALYYELYWDSLIQDLRTKYLLSIPAN